MNTQTLNLCALLAKLSHNRRTLFPQNWRGNAVPWTLLVIYYLPFQRNDDNSKKKSIITVDISACVNVIFFYTISYSFLLQSRGMDLVEILSFLFQLSFSTLGRVSAQKFASIWHLVLERNLCLYFFCYWPCIAYVLQDYSVEGMSDSLLSFLQHLREFGLVFQRKVRHRDKEGRSTNTLNHVRYLHFQNYVFIIIIK